MPLSGAPGPPIFGSQISDMSKDMNYGSDQDDRPRNRMFAGLMLLAVGALLLLRQIGVPFPYWIFSWPMIMIAIGIFIGIRHDFRNPGWVILVCLGVFFLVDQEFMDLSLRRFIVPIIIGIVGVMLIVSPNRRRRRWDRDRAESLGERIERNINEAVHRDYKNTGPLGGSPSADPSTGTTASSASTSGPSYTGTNYGPKYSSSGFRQEGPSGDDHVNEVAVFGGVTRQFFSKDFKGGRVTAVFGGAELSFINADIKGTVYMEVNNVFGGSKLVVPSSWTVKHNISAIFGGIEDKRQVIPGAGGTDPDKVLILHGTCLFGGLEIRNF
jgi:predicted membrane protein